MTDAWWWLTGVQKVSHDVLVAAVTDGKVKGGTTVLIRDQHLRTVLQRVLQLNGKNQNKIMTPAENPPTIQINFCFFSREYISWQPFKEMQNNIYSKQIIALNEMVSDENPIVLTEWMINDIYLAYFRMPRICDARDMFSKKQAQLYS